MNRVEGEFITAKEARGLCVQSKAVFQRVDKNIREACKDNLCYLNWDINGYPKEVVEALEKHLKDLGFKCDYDYDEPEMFHIKW